MIAISIGIVPKNFLNTTEPKIATESVIMNTQTSALVEVSVNIFAPIFPPVIVFPASSRPIRETTAPIAAGGST